MSSTCSSFRVRFPRAAGAAFVAALAIGGCAAPSAVQTAAAGAELNAALEEYRGLIVRMDARAIAALYTKQGTMAHRGSAPVIGRVAIERFLASFAAYRVLEEELVAETTQVAGAHGLQTGRYRQTVATPNDGTVTVNGTFRAEWLRRGDGHWRLENFETAPPP